jgi:DNA-binding beta-propeller fold protein YncE
MRTLRLYTGLLALGMLSVLLAECSQNATEAQRPMEILDHFGAASPVVLDLGNQGDGSDLGLLMDEALLTDPNGQSSLLILPARPDGGLNFEEALAVPDEFTTEIESVADGIYFRPPAEAVDTEGAPIREGLSYMLQILWIGPEGAALSLPSETFMLVNQTTVYTLVLEFPSATGGLAVDGAGNLYAANIGPAPSRTGAEISRITPQGEVQLWVTGQGLSGASGNTFGPDGNLYQSSLNANTIHQITPDGEVSEFTEEGIEGPVGITAMADGSLLVANCRGNSIQLINPEKVSKRVAEGGMLACPNGITVDDEGLIYVANFSNGRVLRISLDGEIELFADVPGGNNGHIYYHQGLLYLVSRGGNQIYTLTLDGDLAVLAGTGERGHVDGPASQATFSLPNDIVVSPDGRRLYINEVVPISGSAIHPSRIRIIELLRPE